MGFLKVFYVSTYFFQIMFTVLKILQIVPQWTLLLLRLILATFCVIITIVSGVQKSDPRWFIYLTNWSFLLLTMAMVGLALISILQAKGETWPACCMSSEIALGEAPQDIRSHSETSDAERAPQAQSNANQVETKSLVWYKKGKIRQMNLFLFN